MQRDGPLRQSRQNEKKTEKYLFFHLKISEFWVLNVPTESAVGWNCIEPEATSLTMQGFTSLPCRFSCPIALVAIPWNNCANTQRLGVAEKIGRPVRDFFARKIGKKNLPFRRNGFENAKKNLRPFSQILVPVRLQGLFLKISRQATSFSLTAVSVELAMLPACDPRLSTNCVLSKSSKALQRVLLVLLGRAPFTKTTAKK